jgi:hypothetical protein
MHKVPALKPGKQADAGVVEAGLAAACGVVYDCMQDASYMRVLVHAYTALRFSEAGRKAASASNVDLLARLSSW